MVIPNKGKVLIRPVDPEKVSKGGIILPDTGQEQKSEGIVVAVGEGARFEKDSRVIYGKYAGDEIVVEGETMRIVRDVEILATVI